MAIVQAIGIGCRRSGSSFLHDCLNEHPDIIKPSRGLHYFSHNYDRGVEWYEAEVLTTEKAAALNVEFSVSYMYPEYNESVATRAHAYNPNAKVFATLRHPVDRAFSDFLRSQRNAEIPADMSFEAALNIYPELFDRGRYGALLQPFDKLYGANNIHILVYEDLLVSLEQYLTPLYDFLGVRRMWPNAPKARAAEAGRGVSNQKLQQILMCAKGVGDSVAYRAGLSENWIAAKRRLHRPYKWLRSINTKEVSMNKSTRDRLLKAYQEDVESVETITGRRLRPWRS